MTFRVSEPPRPRQEVVLALVEQPLDVGGLVDVAALSCGRSVTPRLLTEFTGRRSYAVVAGCRRDERIRHGVEAGEVFW